MRVFLTHNPEDLGAYYGRALPELEALGVDVVVNPRDRDLTTAELIAAAHGCSVIVAHRSTPGPAEVFEQLTDLAAFLRTAVDISTIDVAAASAAGVAVGHADKSFVASTAELALGLLLAVNRHIATSAHEYRGGAEPAQRSGVQLRGGTAGIIGCGAIGSHLAELLVAIGMDVLVHDPHLRVADRLGAAVEQVSFTELLARSDVVFPLAPASPETTDLIDAAAIARMRPGAVLVNVSRGELVDDDAVVEALESGHLAGVGLDVGRAADQRPSPRLAARADVVATPHLGGLTPQNADAQARSSVEQVAAVLDGRMPPRLANGDTAHRLVELVARHADGRRADR